MEFRSRIRLLHSESQNALPSVPSRGPGDGQRAKRCAAETQLGTTLGVVSDCVLRRGTVEGSLNFYDNHLGCGTAADKALAARLGGHSRGTQSCAQVWMGSDSHGLKGLRLDICSRFQG